MPDSPEFILQAEQLLRPDSVFSSESLGSGWIHIRKDRIVAVGDGDPPGGVPVTRLSGTLVPGFVDQHCHGGGGFGYESLDREETSAARRVHLRNGTTSAIASLVSASRSEIRSGTEFLAQECEAGTFDGIHLEGPWISPHRKGAHLPANLRDPSVAEFEDLLELGRGFLRMVTIAPELPNALDVIRACSNAGVVAAVGHTDATLEQTVAAIEAGATAATHLFNTMPGLKHRHPGPIAALLNDDRVSLELIVDGVHLHYALVEMIERTAPDRIVLVTDAMAATGSSDGIYHLGELEVEVTDGVARLTSNGAIAGSTLTMGAAFRHFVIECGATLAQASAATSARPAQLMQLPDRGAILPDARADLCLLDEDLQLAAVWQRGQRVADAGSTNAI